MPLADRLPAKIRTRLRGHGELLRFAMVGGTTFVIDTMVFYALKTSLLESRPVTAKLIATTFATLVSYLLNRHWSFRHRGGRPGHHEVVLYFLVSAIAVGVTSMPLVVSRYGLHLATPYVSRLTQELADFVSAQIIGTAVAMVFRWWAFRRYVFPHHGQGTAKRAALRARGRAARGKAARSGQPAHQLVSVAPESVGRSD